jgi:hypothetical protein
MRVGRQLWTAKGLTKNGQSDSPKNSQLTLFLGTLKRSDDDNVVDDEARTTVPSENPATATTSTEESFLWTHYL